MRKRLPLLALVATTSVAMSHVALAQSSVTMYGIADAGVGKVAGERVRMASGSSLMNNTTSRLGVRGLEDLGGGLKAGFQFETGINLSDGAQQSIGPTFWGRQAHMWLGGNWGTFDMGRTFTPTFSAISAWELTGTANYSAVAKTYGYSGGSRNSSQFSYETPKFGGLAARLGYIFKDDNAGQQKWDANLIYNAGSVVAALGINKQKNEKTGYSVGGRYSFGSFAVAASYNDDHGDRRGFSLGAQARFDPFTLTADLVRDTRALAGSKKYTNGVLEAKYALSKRTFIYAAYLRLDGGNNYGMGLRHNF